MHTSHLGGRPKARTGAPATELCNTMLTSPSLGSTNVDINTQRAIEQLALIVSDVEQRLNIVKTTLAQIVPSLGASPPHVGSMERPSIPFATTSGAPLPVGLPTVFGAPMLAPSLNALALAAYAPLFAGVNAPVSIPTGIVAPGFPFRW